MTVNQKVVGSSPTVPANYNKIKMRFYKVLYTGLFNRDTNIVLSFDKSYKSDFSFEKDRHDFEMSLSKFKIKFSCYRHETLSK